MTLSQAQALQSSLVVIFKGQGGEFVAKHEVFPISQGSYRLYWVVRPLFSRETMASEPEPDLLDILRVGATLARE